MRSDAAGREVFYELHVVQGDYHSLMGIDVLAGRVFQSTDDASAENAAIVSEDFATRYFPGAAPEQVLGRQLRIGFLRDPATIVGVTRATRHKGPDTPSMPSVYIPWAQQRVVPVATLLVDGEVEEVATVVTEVLAAVTPEAEWSPLVPYASYLSAWFAPFRFQLVVVGALAGLGLLLASLGLYSLMAYQVAIDRKELGIRKALGARDGGLMLRVVVRGLAMAVAGVLIGLLVWYRLLPVTGELLVGAETSGALAPILVTLLVGVSCILATLVPALRATRVDVALTLKAD